MLSYLQGQSFKLYKQIVDYHRLSTVPIGYRVSNYKACVSDLWHNHPIDLCKCKTLHINNKISTSKVSTGGDKHV